MSLHRIPHRPGGKPTMDDVHGCVRKFPRNVLAVTFPATRILSTGKDSCLLLLNLCIVFPSDLACQPVDIFVLGFAEKFNIVFVILNSQISVANLSGWPDGILQQVVLNKPMQLFWPHAHEEPEDISWVFLAEKPEILFFSFLITAIRDAAFLQIAVEVLYLKAL